MIVSPIGLTNPEPLLDKDRVRELFRPPTFPFATHPPPLLLSQPCCLIHVLEGTTLQLISLTETNGSPLIFNTVAGSEPLTGDLTGVPLTGVPLTGMFLG
uniref:Uncharacterized protein n=1 Tax=Cacopsylla melanoneura TaxID=428564 RepID=A0A8D8QF35_9HEMI